MSVADVGYWEGVVDGLITRLDRPAKAAATKKKRALDRTSAVHRSSEWVGGELWWRVNGKGGGGGGGTFLTWI